VASSGGRFDGKVIVVAGGATGIGAATAALLARDGAHVVVGDLNEAAGRATVDALTAEGLSARFEAFDISDEEAVRRLIGTAVEGFGRLDGLFSNAADLSPATLNGDTDIVAMDPAIWHHTLAVDLTGFFYTARHAIPHLLAAGGGPIVVTSSAAAFDGSPVRPAYATAKAGLGGLVRHIATRFGKEGIRCNGVAPGVVLHGDVLARLPEDRRTAWAAQHRLRRTGEPQEVGALVAFLLSGEGAWITGQVISVDGGMLLR
jgi:NAD(P)-dependent dehydrogenase (short-subunit alcohol dehydrogenase family)